MIDVLIKNELGNKPVATGRSNDAINAIDLRVTGIDPAEFIKVGDHYMVGLDNGSNMTGRTCTAKAGSTATFTK
ncbi:hypothetical protein [Flavobacterium lipolyticum]|uniref:Uncharacterized protein n=1 Tax=Flavobacterium lipolyticum TaxID=2893754 RepID=A0ABS8LXE1_9FLAO|nr:hypothetical protein [Flavobacterium sp. F-126]MCC9017245.1 hypothetical protein [Flavobacterium sp. F-126]